MTRVRTEVVLAGIFAFLAVATAFWPTWIESLFDESPDAGSGALEWAIVGVFGLLAITAAAFARRDYRAIRRT